MLTHTHIYIYTLYYMSPSLSLYIYVYLYIPQIITIGLALEGHQHHCRLLKEAPGPCPGSTGSAGRDASIEGHHPLGALVETRMVTLGSWMSGEWYVWWLWDGSWFFFGGETTYFFWTCKLNAGFYNLPFFRASSKHVAGSISSGVCLTKMSWYWEILNGEWKRPSGSWHAPIRHSGDRNGVAGVSSARTGKLGVIWQKGLWALYLHIPYIYIYLYLQ